MKKFIKRFKLYISNIKRYKELLKKDNGKNYENVLLALKISLEHIAETKKNLEYSKENIAKLNKMNEVIKRITRYIDDDIVYDEYKALLTNEEFKNKYSEFKEYLLDVNKTDWNAIWFLLKGTRAKGTGLNNW